MCHPSQTRCCTTFAGFRQIASGEPLRVALQTKAIIDRGTFEPVLVFDDATGRQVEMDVRGTADDIARRFAEPPDQEPPAPNSARGKAAESRGPGRPKLGVVAREVTLLPRHWDWLSSQPGGASVTLRKLVEHARHAHAGRDRVRLSQEAANRFMTSLAGNLAGFEEATRALFAGARDRFDELVGAWPTDVGNYARKLAAAALGDAPTTDDTP